MKNSKHNIIYYAIVIVLILLSTIYALAFHKQDILNIFVVYYNLFEGFQINHLNLLLHL